MDYSFTRLGKILTTTDLEEYEKESESGKTLFLLSDIRKKLENIFIPFYPGAGMTFTSLMSPSPKYFIESSTIDFRISFGRQKYHNTLGTGYFDIMGQVESNKKVTSMLLKNFGDIPQMERIEYSR